MKLLWQPEPKEEIKFPLLQPLSHSKYLCPVLLTIYSMIAQNILWSQIFFAFSKLLLTQIQVIKCFWFKMCVFSI